MTAIKNNYIFQLGGDLPASGTSVKISNDLERDQAVVFTNGYVVLRSGNKIERVKGSATGGTLTLSKRGLDQSDTDVEVTALKKDRKEGTTCYVTVLAVQLQEVIDTISSGALLPPSYANDTARDAAITSPENGMIIYNTADGLLNKYVGGTWVDDEGGAVVANASTTVAGKVEVPTDAEITAGTTTGDTGAVLVTTPTQIKKSISLKNTTTTTADTDLFVVSQSGEDKSITQTLLRDQLAASTTKKGTVEMATDAEVAAGTDETRYVNAKQVDLYAGYTIVAGTTYTLANMPTVRSTASGNTAPEVLLKQFTVGPTYKSGTYTLTYFVDSTSSGNSQSNVRITKNGTTSGFNIHTQDYTNVDQETSFDAELSAGDVIRLYCTKTGGSTTTPIDIDYFNVKYDLVNNPQSTLTSTINID